MQLTDTALILSALPHGETGAVVRVLTADHGLRAGFVAGGRGRTLRPVLQPGNRVAVSLRGRAASQLPSMTLELLQSRALLAFDPTSAAALDWLTRLTAATLPEADAHPALFTALDGVLNAMDGPIAGWAMGIPRYELLLLTELGFGLDLTTCALTGVREGLAFVSPNSGRAVSAAAVAGTDYRDKLLPLPAFLLTGGSATTDQLGAALRLTAHFLPRLPGLPDQKMRERVLRDLASGG
ncbi:DNA repair protein RecO [Sandaracinobacteroides saxicola]|uniref:DNA repair protein RecO n=1 Tax=Sandaracinobacteroides saxicola TaxID=2759707 RepID=A0A7G5IFJ3_9SPHN|nr:DNA repair protein RecO [Sandaracinobacteroides saxicola]QMW22135.1 DNA repair protein RecO [Sandaracinobacteroides saxicola]